MVTTPKNTLQKFPPLPETSKGTSHKQTCTKLPETLSSKGNHRAREEEEDNLGNAWTMLREQRRKQLALQKKEQKNKQADKQQQQEDKKKKMSKVRKTDPAQCHKCPNVLQKLQNIPKACQRILRVKRQHQLPSRGLLASCKDAERANKLRE